MGLPSLPFSETEDLKVFLLLQVCLHTESKIGSFVLESNPRNQSRCQKHGAQGAGRGLRSRCSECPGFTACTAVSQRTQGPALPVVSDLSIKEHSEESQAVHAQIISPSAAELPGKGRVKSLSHA